MTQWQVVALDIAGFATILIVMIDLIAMTMFIGEWRLTRAIQRIVCGTLQAVYRVWPNRLVLSASGGAVVLGMFFVWTMVFLSAGERVVNATTRTPAGFWDTVYFAGFSISTLGTGDYAPVGGFWQVMTAVASLNGFSLLTLMVSFIIPVIHAQEFRSQVALRIHHAGRNAEDLILADPQGPPLETLLDELQGELIRLEQSHRTTPVLHRFYEQYRRESIEIAIAALDEALSMVEFGLDGPPPRKLWRTRQSINGYLGSLREAWVEDAENAPPIPSMGALAERGLTLRPLDEIETEYAGAAYHRRRLRALVENSGWSWELVHAREDTPREKRRRREALARLARRKREPSGTPT